MWGRESVMGYDSFEMMIAMLISMGGRDLVRKEGV